MRRARILSPVAARAYAAGLACAAAASAPRAARAQARTPTQPPTRVTTTDSIALARGVGVVPLLNGPTNVDLLGTGCGTTRTFIRTISCATASWRRSGNTAT